LEREDSAEPEGDDLPIALSSGEIAESAYELSSRVLYDEVPSVGFRLAASICGDVVGSEVRR
jgi:hypothetical protein